MYRNRFYAKLMLLERSKQGCYVTKFAYTKRNYEFCFYNISSCVWAIVSIY